MVAFAENAAQGARRNRDEMLRRTRKDAPEKQLFYAWPATRAATARTWHVSREITGGGGFPAVLMIPISMQAAPGGKRMLQCENPVFMLHRAIQVRGGNR